MLSLALKAGPCGRNMPAGVERTRISVSIQRPRLWGSCCGGSQYVEDLLPDRARLGVTSGGEIVKRLRTAIGSLTSLQRIGKVRSLYIPQEMYLIRKGLSHRAGELRAKEPPAKFSVGVTMTVRGLCEFGLGGHIDSSTAEKARLHSSCRSHWVPIDGRRLACEFFYPYACK